MSNVGTPTPENSVQYLGHSDSVVDFVGRFLNIKQHQQAQAGQQLQSMIGLAQQGFPIDVKAFTKMVKKSKLPIATDDETLKAFYDTEIARRQGGEGQSKADPMSMMKGQPQPLQAPQGSPDHVQQAVDMHNKITSSGKAVSPGEMMGMYMNVLAGRARQMMNTKAMTEQQKADNEQHLSVLKSQAIAGDNQARGRLMALGEIKFDIDQEKWNSLSDTQKKGMFDMQAGMETDAEKAGRGQRIGESLITSGRVSNPAAAYKIGDVLAHGGSIPPELKTQIKPNTFGELADQAKMMGSLIEMGVPPDRIGAVMQSAAAGGLENAVPKGMRPLVLEQLGLERSRLGLEELRYAKEVEIAQRAAAAEQRKGITEQAKADIDTFKQLVELKKAGGNIPADLLKGAQTKAATAMNMDVKEVDNLFGFLTGGTHLEFTPRLTDEGKSTVDKFTGKGKSKKEGVVEQIEDTFKKFTSKKKEGV